jgi:hypothetical protein
MQIMSTLLMLPYLANIFLYYNSIPSLIILFFLKKSGLFLLYQNDNLQLTAQRKEKSEADALLKSIKDKKAIKEHEKIQLDSLRKNFQIAADKINQSLGYIFFSKGRLSLELGADQLYHLKVNGHPVEPSKVSCG